jgi:hypothetical protein
MKEFTAVFMKLTMLTPGISIGYWNPRKIPSFALSSGDISSRSFPIYDTVPSVTSTNSRPARTAARVLLPEPLGPIIAWISPCLTFRLIPFRMFFPLIVAFRLSMINITKNDSDKYLI